MSQTRPDQQSTVPVGVFMDHQIVGPGMVLDGSSGSSCLLFSCGAVVLFAAAVLMSIGFAVGIDTLGSMGIVLAVIATAIILWGAAKRRGSRKKERASRGNRGVDTISHVVAQLSSPGNSRDGNVAISMNAVITVDTVESHNITTTTNVEGLPDYSTGVTMPNANITPLASSAVGVQDPPYSDPPPSYEDVIASIHD